MKFEYIATVNRLVPNPQGGLMEGEEEIIVESIGWDEAIETVKENGYTLIEMKPNLKVIK